LLGSNDTLFHYNLVADTLIMKSLFSGKEYRIYRVTDCSPIADWFYSSSISFELPKTRKVVKKNVGIQNMSYSLIIGKIDNEIKMSLSDYIINDEVELKKSVLIFKNKFPENQKSRIFIDLYIDRNIKLLDI